MRTIRFSSLLAVLSLSLAAGTLAQAGIVVGQVDDFEDARHRTGPLPFGAKPTRHPPSISQAEAPTAPATTT